MIPKWLHGKTIGVYDLETTAFPNITEIFCNSVSIITIDASGGVKVTPAIVYTQFWTSYSHGSLMESVTLLNSCDYVCAHNLMGFDIQQIKLLLGSALTAIPLDTLILSKLIFSKDELFAIDAQLGIDKDLFGSYSLKAFGQRLGGRSKIEYSDFSHLNAEMAKYCDMDTNLAVDLLLFLLEKNNFPLETVIDLEHKAADIIAQQTAAGFYINIDMAKELNTKLLQEKFELATELSTMFNSKFLRDGKVKTYKKLSRVKKYLPNEHYIPLLGTKL